MRCKKCGDKTEVLETVQKDNQTRRRRRCLNPSCQDRFSTVEVSRDAVREVMDGELVKNLRRLVRRPGADPEALAAALVVDRRKEEIRRRQREERLREQYEDPDRPPRWLDERGLRREIDGY